MSTFLELVGKHTELSKKSGLNGPLNVSAFNVTGYSSAGFLAYRSSSFSASGQTKIPFDTVEYNGDGNYNPSTGIFTVPITGLYLVNVRLYVDGTDADHYIDVDGNLVTCCKNI